MFNQFLKEIKFVLPLVLFLLSFLVINTKIFADGSVAFTNDAYGAAGNSIGDVSPAVERSHLFSVANTTNLPANGIITATFDISGAISLNLLLADTTDTTGQNTANKIVFSPTLVMQVYVSPTRIASITEYQLIGEITNLGGTIIKLPEPYSAALFRLRPPRPSNSRAGTSHDIRIDSRINHSY